MEEKFSTDAVVNGFSSAFHRNSILQSQLKIILYVSENITQCNLRSHC